MERDSIEHALERIYLWLEEEDEWSEEANALQEVMVLLMALAEKKEVGSIARFYYGSQRKDH